jgi:hypothetical protein
MFVVFVTPAVIPPLSKLERGRTPGILCSPIAVARSLFPHKIVISTKAEFHREQLSGEIRSSTSPPPTHHRAVAFVCSLQPNQPIVILSEVVHST